MRRRAIRYESRKHRDEREQRRTVVRMALVRDHYECRARLLVPDVRCSGALDPHEVIPRSAWRRGYLAVDNVITVCRAHHDWIDDNPDAAAQVGLHGYSWQRPEGEPE